MYLLWLIKDVKNNIKSKNGKKKLARAIGGTDWELFKNYQQKTD